MAAKVRVLSVKLKYKSKKNLKAPNDIHYLTAVDQIPVGLSVILSAHLYEDQIISGETLRFLYIQKYPERDGNCSE